MKALTLFLMLASPLAAKVYFVNQGVKYHIGDDRANRSVDSQFLDAYPVVGQEWIQAFTVDSEDVVKVGIAQVWGVDDCPYCKVLVSINDRDMGRLTQDNNHEPFSTLQPLAVKVYPGRTYLLKIASYGTTQVDDLAFEGVSVETEHAAIKFLDPGPILKMPNEPLPKFEQPVAPQGPCEGVKQATAWLPEESQSKGVLEMSGRADKTLPLSLAAGDFIRLYVKASDVKSGDKVSQALEILLGPADTSSGWAFSFPMGGDTAAHGNMRLNGRYRAERFNISAWKAGQWNELRLARCPDGQTRLWLNSQELKPSINKLDAAAQSVTFKILGLSAQFADKPF